MANRELKIAAVVCALTLIGCDSGYNAISVDGALSVAPGPGPAPGPAPGPSPGPAPGPGPITVPATCMGRSVIYRDWNWSSVGDGSYFASQAPTRLGFTRHPDEIHIVRFKTDNDNYGGRVTGTVDGVWAVGFVSERPCDFPQAMSYSPRMVSQGVTGTTFHFLVASDAAYARMQTDPAPNIVSLVRYTPRLKPNTYYYMHSLNSSFLELSEIQNPVWQANPPETCLNPDCYYLAFDMGHFLRDNLGRLYNGNVIPGYTGTP